MKIILLSLGIFTLLSVQAFANEKPGTVPAAKTTYELAGTVLDKLSGETLGGVEVSVLGTAIHSYTDFDGNFTIVGLEPGTYDIVISYISYEKSLLEKIEVKPGNDNALDIRLISAR